MQIEIGNAFAKGKGSDQQAFLNSLVSFCAICTYHSGTLRNLYVHETKPLIILHGWSNSFETSIIV